MRMFLNGEWVDRPQRIEVRNPFDGAVIDTVPQASSEDVATAVSGAVEGAKVMRRLTALERSKILRKVAELLIERQSAIGGLISREEGKTVAEGTFEVGRAAVTMECSAEEGKRIYGEVLPLDAAPGGANKFGFTLRVPCGVVVAITPFNFPLNLVCHKVGPALAGGNAVIIKPASDTPLSALKLVELLLEAGLPPLAIQCITGGGASVGEALCNDPRVRKVSFTGSAEVGKRICQIAGLKRITMELGSNSPLIVLDDADLNKVAEAVISTGYGNAGQTCISTQRIIATSPVYSALLEALRPKVESIRAGDQLDPQTTMGPMIRERDAERVTQWIEEA
ncbi:MAG: aldehyde dehydrogenase family protein, partial [Nitrospiraceae bacterium]